MTGELTSPNRTLFFFTVSSNQTSSFTEIERLPILSTSYAVSVYLRLMRCGISSHDVVLSSDSMSVASLRLLSKHSLMLDT
jgi:hypothetical protein